MTGNAQIGVWWLVSGRVLAYSEPTQAVPTIDGWRDVSVSHFDYWNNTALHENPCLAGQDYTDNPRGRILYRTSDNSYVVYSSLKFTRDKSAIDHVISAFNLSGENVRVVWDRHYDKAIPLMELDD